MSRTTKAQRLANEANIIMTQETNETNRQIAESNNQWNWSNLQAQNEWNIQQWERENAYNDPSAQMERLIKAGINPLFAMGAIDTGNAQHLESGQPLPADNVRMQAPHVEPEYDPMLAQHVGNIIASSRDLLNAGQGFERLGLERQDVLTRQAAQRSRSAFDIASAAEKRASTTGQEIQNQWNLQTFDIRSKSETQKLFNMQKQYDLMDANTEEAKSKKLQIDESKKLISEQINQVIASIRQRDHELSIMQQQVSVAERNADVNQDQLDLSRQQFGFEQSKFKSQIEQWNNENLLKFMENFGQKISAELKGGVEVQGLGVSAKGSSQELLPASMQKFTECGLQVLKNYADDPGNVNKQKDAQRAVDMINSNNILMRKNIFDEINFNTSTHTILNPSGEDW